jgi:hypothetical protein
MAKPAGLDTRPSQPSIRDRVRRSDQRRDRGAQAGLTRDGEDPPVAHLRVRGGTGSGAWGGTSGVQAATQRGPGRRASALGMIYGRGLDRLETVA